LLTKKLLETREIFSKEASAPENKVEQTSKPINTTKPTKYILSPSLNLAECDAAIILT
jgi:hypothetical protein